MWNTGPEKSVAAKSPGSYIFNKTVSIFVLNSELNCPNTQFLETLLIRLRPDQHITLLNTMFGTQFQNLTWFHMQSDTESILYFNVILDTNIPSSHDI
jgi:hypothetical protein